jgi:hypothetical protein
MNPLRSVGGTIIGGTVLAVIIAAATSGINYNVGSLIVWFHVLAGITWIGLLYYFNFVQVPALGEAVADEGGPGGAGIAKYVAPRALWWFRWGALATWLSGAGYLGHLGRFQHAFTLGMLEGGGTQDMVIGVGAWLHGRSKCGRNCQSQKRGVSGISHQHISVNSDDHEHGRLRSRRVFPVTDQN